MECFHQSKPDDDDTQTIQRNTFSNSVGDGGGRYFGLLFKRFKLFQKGNQQTTKRLTRKNK